jgi:ankyrin repeat protein
MIDPDEFFEIESLIEWGPTDPSRQAEFVARLRSCPGLATGTDGFGNTLLMSAAEAANLEAVRALCLQGADAGALAETGDTPLICAVRGLLNDSPEAPSLDTRAAIVLALIEHGADPNRLGWQGCSALHCAIVYGAVGLVRALLAGGADPQVRLCDPPSREDAIELAESGRFHGSDADRQQIIFLLKQPRLRPADPSGRQAGP